jgi:7-cyano-7-deazaguanine synthase in queuosine biosynthesis
MAVRRCARCVLPEFEPDIRLDAEGVCNVCRDHDARGTATEDAGPLESDFVRLLEKYRGKGRYDCLVMCSGGKDSTASLYLMKRRYRMNPLAFTFDLGFETDEALGNVHRAVDALDVDLVIHKSRAMIRLFRRILETDRKVVICHLCSISYMRLTFETAHRYGVRLIIAGWTKGQTARIDDAVPGRYAANAPEYVSMARATKEFVKTLRMDPEYRDVPATMEEVVKAARRTRCIVQSPHWYLPEGTETHIETLTRELGWREPKHSYPAGSTNCSLNFLSSHLSMRHYGYTHYHVEMSKLIRLGLMSREEALRRLEADFDDALLADLAARCGCAAPGEVLAS